MTGPAPPHPTISLGALTIRPATCEVIVGARRLVLEPQVMRVLAMLARDAGTVVSRDELVARCWDGRSVSEDAINRVISRLRKLAVETAAFELQTQRKVGYRLVAIPPVATGEEARPEANAPLPAARRSRWPAAAAAAALVLLLLGLAAWILPASLGARSATKSLAIHVTADRPGDRAGVQAFTSNLRQSLLRVRGLRLLDGAATGTPDLTIDGSFGSTRERPILLTLKDGSDGSAIWSGRFARSPLLLPEQQRAVAAAVRYVAVWLSDRGGGEPSAREPERSDVSALVADGLQQWQTGREKREQGKPSLAMEHYAVASAKADAALALDPESPRALMLRYQIDLLPAYPRPGETVPAFRNRLQRADEMLTRALSADPDDPAVLVAAARDFGRASDWAAAGALLRRAVRLGPSSADANTWYAFHLALVGRCREGLRYARKGVELDPGSSWRRRAIPRLMQGAGDTSGALREYARLLRDDRANGVLAYETYLVALSGGRGRLAQLATFLRHDLWQGDPPPGILAVVDRAEAAAAHRDGRAAAFDRLLDQEFRATLENRKPVSASTAGDTMFALAYEYAHARRVDRALDALTRAHDAGSTYLPWALPFGSHEFPPPLRSDPRYRALWLTPAAWAELMRERETTSLATAASRS